MSAVAREAAIAAIRAFIGAEPQQGRNAFFISLDRRGNPSIRQVSTFIEGWTVWTVSQAQSLKLKHLRRDPRGQYLWVEDQPARRRKNVWMRGTVTLIEDEGAVAEFMERRSRALGFSVPQRDWQRVVMRFEPDYLRAEGFLGEEAGNTPVIMRRGEFAAIRTGAEGRNA
ncbi:MAG: hypothetical protein RMM58_06060 [Chloroflexota bacterium]|nr:pyridoxamine 5'-phosphate oxidase family protein [Dehalococcoidia bacterium]MDW8253425.1 hypothetical protein [Chloroflexota bacterium]